MGNIKKLITKLIAFVVSGGGIAALILFSWGFDDVGGFFMHPARVVMFISMVSLFFLAAFFTESRGVKFTRKGEKGKPRELITGVALPTLIWILMMIMPPYSDSHNFLVLGGGDLLRYSGVIIYVIGSILSVWGLAHLGKQFSALVTIQEGHKLVTDGPFNYIRHPRYSGIVFWVFGTAMIFRSLLGLVGALLMTILFLWRIKDEEWEGYCNQKFEGIRMTKKIVYEILPRALWIFMAVCLYLGQKLTNSSPVLTDTLFLFCSGILLSVGGFLLWMYVGYSMRRALFTKELMVSGPFKYIRHPMYVGIYIMLVGIGLLFFSWIWFITMLIFIPIWYLDCKIEEKQMTQLQGKKYLEYKKRTGMFFPELF